MSRDLSKLFDTLSEKPPHPLDPYLNAIQRRAYTTEDKDGIVERIRAAVDPDFLRRDPTMSGEVPTIDELRAFLHKQIAECRQHRPEDVDGLLEKLHSINETHAFIEQTIGDRAASAWLQTIPTTVAARRAHE